MIPILALCVIAAMTIGGPTSVEGQDVISQVNKVFEEVWNDPCTRTNREKFLAAVDLLLSNWATVSKFDLEDQVHILKALPHQQAAEPCSEELSKEIRLVYRRHGIDISSTIIP